MTQLRVISCNNRSNTDLLIAIHRLRFRVFKGRLDWEVAVSGSMEIDHYDIYNPVYIVLLDDADTVIGSARLLPTEGPNMLADTFPMLLHGAPAPRGARIWEVSRLCVDTELAAAAGEGGLRLATHTLVVGIAEWANGQGIRQLAAVTDLPVERILRRAGCAPARIGAPIVIGKAAAVATLIDISDATVATMRLAGGMGERRALVSEVMDAPAPARRRA